MKSRFSLLLAVFFLFHLFLAPVLGSTESQEDEFNSLIQMVRLFKRDINKAGLNQTGMNTYAKGTPLPFLFATSDSVVILSDLNGDGKIAEGTDEKITYSFHGTRNGKDEVAGKVQRGGGNQQIVDHLSHFRIRYRFTSGVWSDNPSPGELPLIRQVKLTIGQYTGDRDRQGKPLSIKIELDVDLKNF